MISYERSIMDFLKGDTPKQKFDHLMDMMELLRMISFPKRGTQEETMTIYDAAGLAGELIDQDGEYKRGEEDEQR
jgi:hypothetical protein